MTQQTCTRCNQVIDADTAIMLELDSRTGLYHLPGIVAPEWSQGGFLFGRDCADYQVRLSVMQESK